MFSHAFAPLPFRRALCLCHQNPFPNDWSPNCLYCASIPFPEETDPLDMLLRLRSHKPVGFLWVWPDSRFDIVIVHMVRGSFFGAMRKEASLILTYGMVQFPQDDALYTLSCLYRTFSSPLMGQASLSFGTLSSLPCIYVDVLCANSMLY